MGGTSCDVCLIEDSEVSETAARLVAGRPLSLPALDIHTVGAGGGSIAWRDSGGALRVGPASAGAVPGPACYGRGGLKPTVTDANLLLGRLLSDAPLAGELALDRAAAEAVVGALARELEMDTLACAEGIVRVAEAEVPGGSPEELLRAFAGAHEDRYGYREDAAEVELVNIRVSAWGPAPRLRLHGPAGPPPEPARTEIVFDGVPREASVLRGEPGRDT